MRATLVSISINKNTGTVTK